MDQEQTDTQPRHYINTRILLLYILLVFCWMNRLISQLHSDFLMWMSLYTMRPDLQEYVWFLSLGPWGGAGCGSSVKGVVLVLLPGTGPHAVRCGCGRSLPVQVLCAGGEVAAWEFSHVCLISSEKKIYVFYHKFGNKCISTSTKEINFIHNCEWKRSLTEQLTWWNGIFLLMYGFIMKTL